MANPDVVGEIPKKGGTEAGPTQGSSTVSAPSAEPKPTKVLPTPRVGFAKQLTMLRGYAALASDDKPVSNAAVSELAKLHPNTGVLATPFFIDVGFIQKVGAGYLPAAEVIQYHRAVAWNPESAPLKLAPLLRRAWFSRKLLPKLSMGPLSEQEAVEVLAEESAAAPRYLSQLAFILEYMAVVGLIRREGGQVRSGDAIAVEETPIKNEIAPMQESESAQREQATRASVATAFSHAPEGVLRFNVDVSVDMKEFATWRPERISAFWAGIAAVLAAKAQVELKVPGR